MSDVARGLWLTRVGAVAPVAAFAAAAVAARPSVGASVALGVSLVVGGLGAVATAALVRALRRGDRGDLLLRSGARVPMEAWRRVHRWDRLEGAVTLGVVAAVVATSEPGVGRTVFGVLGAGVALFSVLLHHQLRRTSLLLESHAAMVAGDLDQADRLLISLERVELPSIRAGVRGQKATIAIRRGRPERAIELLEAGWSGVLDDRAGQLAILHLGRGDAELARRYVEATTPDGRYLTFLLALLRARIAVHDRRWDDALAASRAPCDVPPFYHRQLGWVEVAALAGGGRLGEAAERVAALGGLGSDPHLKAADPLVYQLASDAVAGRTSSVAPGWTPSVPTPAARLGDDPFRPPTGRPHQRGRRGVGIVPVESVVVGVGLPRWMAVFRRVMAVALLGVGGLYGSLLVAMSGFGRAAEWYELGLCAIVLAVGATYAVYAVAERAAGPAAVLSDGRKIGANWFPLVAVGAAVPAGAVLAAASASILTSGSPWLAVALAPFALLAGWSAWSRWRVLRLIRAVHFAPAAEAAARARSFRGGALLQGSAVAQWTALAVLWSGDRAGAEQILDELLRDQPWFDGLKNWFRAGRGELDLERALAEPEPEELGERYRWAVTVAVAVLRAGCPERARGRVPGWTQLSDRLPNRFGALLLHLARRVDGVRPSADPELAWVEEWVSP